MKLRKRLCDEMQPSYAWELLCPGVVKSMEKHRKLRISTFRTILRKENYLAHIDN